MQLPTALEEKFTQLLGRYPVKRSALISMMMYAQDQFGFLSDEVLEEIAKRVDLNVLQVTETMAYYSMLRRKPAGRYHIQVCTNISCMLRGAQEVVDYVERKLGIKTGDSTPDGRIYLKREEECLAACTGAPMLMVDHVYHENLTPESIDKILDELT